MLINIQTYLHFGKQTKFKTKKEFTKIKKRTNVQKDQDKWMMNNCTFSYKQLFDGEAGEMMDPVMFFDDLTPVEFGTTDTMEGWCGGSYEYEVYDIVDDADLPDIINQGRYIIVKPHPSNVNKGKPLDEDFSIFECKVYVFKDMDVEFIFNIYGAAILSYTDGSELLVLGEYKIDEKKYEVFTDWYHYDLNYGQQRVDNVDTEAEYARDNTEDWSLLLGDLPIPS